MFGVLTASGDYTQEHKQYTRPTFSIRGVKTKYELELDAVLDTTLVNETAEISIPAGKKVWVDFLPLPA